MIPKLLVNVSLWTKCDLQPTAANLTPPEFTWKGHSPLNYTPNANIKALLQIHPPAAITALDCSGDFIAAGTAHGLCVFDYKTKSLALIKSTLGGGSLSIHKLFITNTCTFHMVLFLHF